MTSDIANIRKKFHETHELISTSYHEAGHTIYGLLHFFKIESVSVFKVKSKRIEGFCHYNSIIEIPNIKDPNLFKNRLHAEIGLFYSGLIAEKYFFKTISGSNKFPMFLREGSSYDIKYVANLFQKYNLSESGRKRYNYKQKLIKNINSEILDNWDAVSLVAHTLYKKKKIYYFELQELLLKKSSNKQFWKQIFKNINYLYNTKGLDEKDISSILLT